MYKHSNYVYNSSKGYYVENTEKNFVFIHICKFSNAQVNFSVKAFRIFISSCSSARCDYLCGHNKSTIDCGFEFVDNNIESIHLNLVTI